MYRLVNYLGSGSSVSIATGYWLDGPGIETLWSEIFRTCPDRPWGPPSLLYNGYRVFPGGKSGWSVTLTLHPLLVPGQERVELYVYSPCGPYGLYRASVPVQGCSLPLTILLSITSMYSFKLHFVTTPFTQSYAPCV